MQADVSVTQEEMPTPRGFTKCTGCGGRVLFACCIKSLPYKP
jgi:hypothetical protein